MKKLITMSFFALGTLSMFAGTPVETKNNDQSILNRHCYKFEFSIKLLKNWAPQGNTYNHTEYGYYTEFQAQLRYDELSLMYPFTLDKNGTGQMVLSAYNKTSNLECLSGTLDPTLPAVEPYQPFN